MKLITTFIIDTMTITILVIVKIISIRGLMMNFIIIDGIIVTIEQQHVLITLTTMIALTLIDETPHAITIIIMHQIITIIVKIIIC